MEQLEHTLADAHGKRDQDLAKQLGGMQPSERLSSSGLAKIRAGLSGEEPRLALLASLHGFDLSRVLYIAGSNRAPEVTVFGIEPARIEWGTELSPTVQRVVPAVEEAILNELAR